MKWTIGLLSVLVLGVSSAWAQGDASASISGEAPIRIADTEAVTIVKTINGYMEGTTHRGRLEILDRKKGELVTLRLDRIVTDDPTRIVFPNDGQIAVCGECTQMIMEQDKKGEPVEKETENKYEVWFVVQRGGIATSRVLDTFVKSVNGKQMYKWTKDATGHWSATLVPDSE